VSAQAYIFVLSPESVHMMSDGHREDDAMLWEMEYAFYGSKPIIPVYIGSDGRLPSMSVTHCWCEDCIPVSLVWSFSWSTLFFGLALISFCCCCKWLVLLPLLMCTVARCWNLCNFQAKAAAVVLQVAYK
jgi:hypothetical protein